MYQKYLQFNASDAYSSAREDLLYGAMLEEDFDDF